MATLKNDKIYFQQDIRVDGDVSVGGDITLDDITLDVLAVTGNGTVGGTFGVTGATTLSSTLGVTGAATLSSTLGVTGNTTVTANIQKTVGQKTYKLVSASETLSALSGATAATTNLIPAGARLKGVSCEVTTLIEGATSFNIGDGTDADRFGAAIALAATTTTDDTDATADPSGWSATAQDVTLTAVGSNFTAGEVVVTALYEIIE